MKTKNIILWRTNIFGILKIEKSSFCLKIRKNDFIPDIAPVTMDGIKRPAGTLIPNVTTVNADLTFTDFIWT